MFELCCSPISGGNFISQVAILTLVLEVRNKSPEIKKPHLDLYLGASGGSLANTMTTFFEDTKESIERILYTLNSKMFVKNWLKGKFSGIDSKLISLFKNSIYESGSGAIETFSSLTGKDHFSKKKSPENWFLTFNNDKNIPVIHTTSTREDTIFNDLEDSEISYLDFRVDKILETVMASASIPGLKNTVVLENENHVDGGVANPSPYPYFSESLYQKSVTGEINFPYHYYYILPNNLEPSKKGIGFWISDMITGIQKMISFNILKDKEYTLLSWLRIIKKSKKDLTKINISCIDKRNMLKILEKYHQNNYFISLYTDRNTIDITNFDKKDLQKGFNNCYKSISLEIYIDL